MKKEASIKETSNKEATNEMHGKENFAANGKIVVGVDGSTGSIAALHWAYNEAQVRNCRLEILSAWHFPVAVSMPGMLAMPAPEDLQDSTRTSLLQLLQKEGVTADGPVEVTTAVGEGNAAELLLTACKQADLLVVGSRGHGGFGGLLLGSVSQQCVTHAKCPVVVVHS